MSLYLPLKKLYVYTGNEEFPNNLVNKIEEKKDYSQYIKIKQ